MHESEITRIDVTWFKASLLTMVYTIVLSGVFVALVRLPNGLPLAIITLIASILGTLVGAAIRPRPELKIWLMLAAVSLALTIATFLAFAASDI
jgi:hypothetical protein